MADTQKHGPEFGQGIFTLLLRLLPREFREHFGREMRAVFADQSVDARAEGRAAQARLWLSTCAGIIATAFREHLDIVERDIVYSFRVIRKDPAFLISSVAILGLGIGTCTAAFLAAYAILLRPLPFSSGDRLVQISQKLTPAGVDTNYFSAQEVRDLRTQGSGFESVFEYHEMPFTLLGGREPQRVDTGVVSANFFHALGISPLHGRDFFEDDEKMDAAPVLILSYQFWERAFGRDPNIIGRRFSMNDREHIVVGVLPPLPQFPEVVDVYMPTSACPTRSNPKTIDDRGRRMVQVFGTLKPAATLAQTQAELHQIAARQQSQTPQFYAGMHDVSLSPESDDLRRPVRPILIALASASGLLLLLACANTAGLMLSRMLARARDLGIRSALGASTTRLVRSNITEGLVLSFMGGAVGLVLAFGSIGLLANLTGRFTTLSTQLHIGAEVIAFWLVVTCVVGVCLGVAPAVGIQTSSLWGMPLGKPVESRRSHAVQRAVLVSVQLALSVVLLVSSGLALRSLMRLERMDGGFTSEGMLTARIYFLKHDFEPHYKLLMDRTRSLPGVESVGLASAIPLNARGISVNQLPIHVVGEKMPRHRSAQFVNASRDYFRTIGVRVVEGRSFLESDVPGSPSVAVISRHMAQHYWGDESPVGKQISIFENRILTIVGVVSDVRQAGLDKEPLDEVFVPWEQFLNDGMAMVVRTSGNTEEIARDLGWIVHDIDKDAVIADVQPMTKVRTESLASPRITATFLTIFAVIALAITASGISGMMALMVNDRKHEIGIRLALGATPGAVMRAMLAKVAPAMGAGLAAGLTAAWWLSHSMDKIAIGVPARDALTFATSSLVLVGTAVLFAVAPLTTISRLDPSTPLRAE